MPQITIVPAAYRRISEYANFAGISAEKAVKEAVNEWMDTTGDLLIEYDSIKREQLPHRRS
jgi:hypothetical protein